MPSTRPPLIVHLIYRYAMGGMEIQLTERLNRMPEQQYRHAVITLAGIDREFVKHLKRPDVAMYDLGKQPGLSLGTHLGLWRLLRSLRPAVLHTYNLSAMEYGVVAVAAGVPVRINGAHGREADDLQGKRTRHRLLRRFLLPWYDCCYANSRAMEAWNREHIGVPVQRSRFLPNGVNTDWFMPGPGAACAVVGTVGRLDRVKGQAILIDAVALLRGRAAEVRLIIVGDGPCLRELRQRAEQRGVAHLCSIVARADVLPLLQQMTVFALPSLAEGTPGAVLEAMACGLPVVASRVGGLPELIEDGVSGTLVDPGSPEAMAAAIERYLGAPELAREHGSAARRRAEELSMQASSDAYLAMYDELCARKLRVERMVPQCVES
jgi:sugar transferase (PEP-CTERM/EpsH1 system associated)